MRQRQSGREGVDTATICMAILLPAPRTGASLSAPRQLTTLRRPTSRRLDTRALMRRTANVADRPGLPLEVAHQLRCIAPFQAFFDEPSERDLKAHRQSQLGRRASGEDSRPIEHVRWQYEEDLRLVHAHHPPCGPSRETLNYHTGQAVWRRHP